MVWILEVILLLIKGSNCYVLLIHLICNFVYTRNFILIYNPSPLGRTEVLFVNQSAVPSSCISSNWKSFWLKLTIPSADPSSPQSLSSSASPTFCPHSSTCRMPGLATYLTILVTSSSSQSVWKRMLESFVWKRCQVSLTIIRSNFSALCQQVRIPSLAPRLKKMSQLLVEWKSDSAVISSIF